MAHVGYHIDPIMGHKIFLIIQGGVSTSVTNFLPEGKYMGLLYWNGTNIVPMCTLGWKQQNLKQCSIINSWPFSSIKKISELLHCLINLPFEKKHAFMCRNSSVGRALDWRSKGPWFDPGFRQPLWFNIDLKKVYNMSFVVIVSQFAFEELRVPVFFFSQ